jgi:methylmalonyl-CoA/ethylmalonyl-CoA epimerase
MSEPPALKGLHHIGVAVASLQDALPRWTGLGLVLESIEEVPTEQVRVAVLRAGSQRIELLEPTSPDSPVAKFLQKRGPGIHHLAFAVDDCQRQLDTAPRPGAHGCRVAFVHPKHLGGVLAELVEDPADHGGRHHH